MLFCPRRVHLPGRHGLTSLAAPHDRLASAAVPRSPPLEFRTPWIEVAVRIAPYSTPAAPVDNPWLGTGRNIALLCGQAGQDLSLLALGHLEVVDYGEGLPTDQRVPCAPADTIITLGGWWSVEIASVACSTNYVRRYERGDSGWCDGTRATSLSSA